MTGHGGHAPYMKAPAFTLVPLPDEISFEEGAAISCGTGTAYGALRRINISGRDTLAVFGQGPVGLSATMLGAAMGARVIAVDIAPERLKLARDFGADAVINSKETDPIAALKQLTHGEGVDAAMDCSGHPDARAAAVRSTRTWGQVCFVGEGGQVTLDVSPDMLRRQLTIVASWTFNTRGPGGVRALHRRPQGAAQAAPHPPLQARRGGGRLPALRHADHRERACSSSERRTARRSGASMVGSTVPQNLLGAVLTFVYFRYLDPAAAGIGARAGRVRDRLLGGRPSRCSPCVGYWLGRRWTRRLQPSRGRDGGRRRPAGARCWCPSSSAASPSWAGRSRA